MKPGPAGVSIVGTTASGKSALAMAVARRRDEVEIISVDSMCVYRGMDIATAKPTAEERGLVPHHLLDLVEPTEEFTVSQFQGAAREALAGIGDRGRRGLLVGGTGLYLRSVIDDLTLPGRWPEVAAALEREADGGGGTGRAEAGAVAEAGAGAALHARLAALDPLAASRIEPGNRRRVVRALEVTLGSGRPFSSFGPGLGVYAPTRFVLLGLPFIPEVVDARIAERFSRWMDDGLLEEVRRLAALEGGLSRTARQALGYKELLDHVIDGAPLAGCVEAAITRTRGFARRQWAWFRRDPRIVWLDPPSAEVAVGTALDSVVVPGAERGRAGSPHDPAV